MFCPGSSLTVMDDLPPAAIVSHAPARCRGRPCPGTARDTMVIPLVCGPRPYRAIPPLALLLGAAACARHIPRPPAPDGDALEEDGEAPARRDAAAPEARGGGGAPGM